MLTAAAAILLASSLLFGAALAPRGAVSRVLSVGLVAWGQVVFLCEVLSELRALGPRGFFAGEAVLLVAALATWSGAGRPEPLPALSEAARALRAFVRGYPWLAAFAAALALAWVVNAGWSCLYEPLDGDANAYHLPRAYYWTTLGTARHFPTSDFRLTQMPPNSSFLAAWALAFSRGFRGLHLFQAVAGILLACASAGLARLSGARRPAALFAGLLVLTYPVVVLQMGTPQNDLLVAAAGMAAAFFGLCALRRTGADLARAAACFGLSVGLAVGTKLTIAFLAPGLVILLAAASIGREDPGTRRALGALAAGGLAGLVLFAAYNPLLNAQEFGNFFIARPGLSHFFDDRPEAIAGRFANAVQYARAMPAATPEAGRAAFGPLAVGLGAAAPFVFAGAIVGWRRRRRGRPLIRAALILAAAAYAATYLATDPPFFPEVARYFVPASVLLAAAILPLVFFDEGPGRFATSAVACVALAVALWLTRAGPDRVRFGTYRAPRFADDLREGVMSVLARTLPRCFPPGSRLGVVSEYNDTIFHLMRALPAYDFVPVNESDVPRLVGRGTVAAAVVGEFRKAAGQGITKPGLAMPRNVLHVPDPVRFFREHPEQFGLVASPHETGVAFRIAVDREGLWSGDAFLVRLPSGLARAAGEGSELTLPLGARAPAGVTASCDGVPAWVRADGDTLNVRVPTACVRDDRVFLDLTLVRPAGGAALPVRGEARLTNDGTAGVP